MPSRAQLLDRAFPDGYASVFLTLALCLSMPFGGIGIVATISVITIAASRFRLIMEAVRLYFGPWLRSDAFRLNLLILIVTLVELGLLLYHRDDTGDFENQLKQYLIALAVLLTIRRHPIEAVLAGAAVGCVVAGLISINEAVVLDLPRAEGPTNSIRFGMIASLMAMLCWIGVLFGQLSRPTRAALAVAAAFGVMAAVLSGSRGAVMALPIMLLLIVPRIWHRSPRAAIIAGLLSLVFSVGAGTWQAQKVRAGVSDIFAIFTLVAEGRVPLENSARDRLEMLQVAESLFWANPFAGVGANGWNEAVTEQIRTSPPGSALEKAFNQPHNQYANDLAKGGLLRGLGGFAMLAFPFWLFLKRRPFKSREDSLAPLMGIMVCGAFAVFGLTEAVMDLSLTGSIYTILIFYLICACEGSPLSTPSRTAVAKGSSTAN